MMRQIILASTSPRRKELLEAIGLVFTAVPSTYDEDMTQHADPEKMVRIFSYEKAVSLVSGYPDAIIIGADTVVAFEDSIFGKPSSIQEATMMLSRLSGTTHMVFTGYTVIDSASKKSITEVVKTEIKLAHLSEAEIQNYFEKTSPLDKAGAYAIQGFGATFTERISGEYTNVVGLPLCSLMKTLKEFGVNLMEDHR